MAITFTNKAAKEMKERVNKLLETGGEDVWVSTFHSMCEFYVVMWIRLVTTVILQLLTHRNKNINETHLKRLKY